MDRSRLPEVPGNSPLRSLGPRARRGWLRGPQPGILTPTWPRGTCLRPEGKAPWAERALPRRERAGWVGRLGVGETKGNAGAGAEREAERGPQGRDRAGSLRVSPESGRALPSPSPSAASGRPSPGPQPPVGLQTGPGPHAGAAQGANLPPKCWHSCKAPGGGGQPCPRPSGSPSTSFWLTVLGPRWAQSPVGPAEGRALAPAAPLTAGSSSSAGSSSAPNLPAHSPCSLWALSTARSPRVCTAQMSLPSCLLTTPPPGVAEETPVSSITTLLGTAPAGSAP